MTYKKYRAKTLQEAKLKMLLDVGHQAYIVSHKKVKEGGFFGFFGKPMVEITVGILNQATLQQGAKSDVMRKMDPDYLRYISTDKTSVKSSREAEKLSLHDEVNDLKSLVTRILTDGRMDLSGAASSGESEAGPRRPSDKTKDLAKMLLKEEEFDDQFIQAICSLSSVEIFLSKENNLSQIRDYLKSQINQVIEVSNGIDLDQRASNIIILVGPTGVGKTTTLAKLGAYFGVFRKKKVKFVSIDTYRVGAIQQLKLYADIMDIPFSKVNNVEEFRMEFYHDDYDLILVDTMGRSQKNIEEIRDIKEYLDAIDKKFDVSLVVSATTKYTDLVEILDQFDILTYNNIILTKLDETSRLGQVISALSPKKRELSYVTFGQSVPEDIEIASKNKLFDMILKN